MLLICNYTEAKNIKYKNISANKKIAASKDGQNWFTKYSEKSDNICIIKKITSVKNAYSEFYDKQGNFIFSAGTQYEFIHNKKLIGYSNDDLKFYELTLNNNGILCKNELAETEIQELFPKYRIVKLSEFSTSTNSLKIAKKKHSLKIILFNDTDMDWRNISFTTNNSKIKTYPLKGVIDITKKGMIHFSNNSNNTNWYILLIR